MKRRGENASSGVPLVPVVISSAIALPAIAVSQIPASGTAA